MLTLIVADHFIGQIRSYFNLFTAFILDVAFLAHSKQCVSGTLSLNTAYYWSHSMQRLPSHANNQTLNEL